MQWSYVLSIIICYTFDQNLIHNCRSTVMNHHWSKLRAPVWQPLTPHPWWWRWWMRSPCSTRTSGPSSTLTQTRSQLHYRRQISEIHRFLCQLETWDPKCGHSAQSVESTHLRTCPLGSSHRTPAKILIWWQLWPSQSIISGMINSEAAVLG